MDSQSTDGALLGRKGGVYFAFCRRVERLATVTDDEYQVAAFLLGRDVYIAFRAFGISIAHYVDDSLLDGQIHLQGIHLVEAECFADLIDESG